MSASGLWHRLAYEEQSSGCILGIVHNGASPAKMIPFAKPVLFVGNDPMLSKATAEVLKAAGFKVKTTNPRNSGHVIAGSGYLAIILCATLESAEAMHVIDAAERFQPGVPIVSVHLGLLGDAPPANSSIIVDALNGPEALIQAVKTVTTQRKAAS